MKRKMIDATKATLQESAKDLVRIEWHEACLPKHQRSPVTKVTHYYLSVKALSACGHAQADMTRPDLPAGRPVQVREDEAPYGGGES